MGVGDILPKIEGFQPIPNAVMIPFMEVQSAALAYGFGLNYEYSKRKIRSMSNETFNSTTPEDIEQMQAAHTKVLLDGFIKRVSTVMPAQIEIFKQYVEIEKAKVLQNVALAKWIATNAPSIITTGKTASTDIVTTPTTNNPPATTSSDAKSISQDAQGNVTTSSISASDLAKIKTNISNNLNALRAQLKKEQAKVWQTQTKFKNGRNIRVFINPQGQKDSAQLVVILKKEILAQQEQLARVNRGQTPY